MTGQAVVFVGSITRATPYFDTAEGEGISILHLDEASGQLSRDGLTTGIDNPAFMSFHANRRTLFVTSEVYGWNEGTVTAYHFDLAGRTLHYINKQATLGSITAHNSIDRSGRYVLVSNYAHERWAGPYGPDVPGQAVAVFPIDERGGLGAATSSVAHEGSGPVASRQGEPHPHCAISSPDSRFVLVADLGIDAVVTYRFEAGRLSRAASLAMAPGAGPRHLIFAPGGRSVYVINELDSTITHLAYDPATGRLQPRQTIPTLPSAFSGENRCSDLQLSADGRFLYGANRGHDSVTVLRVDPADGGLEVIQHCPCGGHTPRNMDLSPSGTHLLVANQNSHTVAILRRDQADGRLEQVGALDVGTPMVVAAVVI